MIQLEAKDYLKTKTGWKTNRDQVLWEVDMALPSLEEVHIAKPLQLVSDQDEVPEGKGGLGDAKPCMHTHAEALAHGFVRAVQQATGQVLLVDNVVNHARRVDESVTVEQVIEATLTVCRARLQARQGVPSFADIAEVL